MEFTFSADLWEWEGKGAWCFVTLPTEYYDELRLVGSGPKRGFGSIRVEAGTGVSAWKTSIFPDTKSQTYLLPVKKDIRAAEHIAIGDTIQLAIKLLDI